MRYSFNIYSLNSLQASFVNNEDSSKIPYISIGSDGVSFDLILNNIYNLQYSYTSMSAPCNIDVIGFQVKSPRLNRLISTSEIQSGDIIEVYEENIKIYIGYITTIKESYSNGGQILSISFDTLLSQFGRQSMIQSNKDVKCLTPTGTPLSNIDGVFNNAKMKDLLGFLMVESIYTFATQLQTFSVKYGTPELLNENTIIPYVPSTQSTKEEILLNSTFFYQVLIYQDISGNIILDTPSDNNKSTFHIKNGDVDLRNWEEIRSEATIPNNLVYSIIYTGFFPPLGTSSKGENGVIQMIPNSKEFARLNFLYNSGYMSQVQLISQNLVSSIISDPTLIEIGTNFYNKAIQSNIPPNSKNVPSSINLPASRQLAKMISQSNYVIVELERNNRTKEIPLGKVFYLNSKPWFCINVNIKCIGAGNNVVNTMTLMGVPLYSITGYWK